MHVIWCSRLLLGLLVVEVEVASWNRKYYSKPRAKHSCLLSASVTPVLSASLAGQRFIRYVKKRRNSLLAATPLVRHYWEYR
jgi:hypothetical protein